MPDQLFEHHVDDVSDRLLNLSSLLGDRSLLSRLLGSGRLLGGLPLGLLLGLPL